MKNYLYVVFIIIPSVLFCQTSKYLFKTDKNHSIIMSENDTVVYNYKPIKYLDNNGNIMLENVFIYKNDSLNYSNNSISIDDFTFKFKRPIFNSKTYLVNIKTKEVLASFSTNYDSNTIDFDINNKVTKKYDSDTIEILLKWSLFHQTEYVHYNQKGKNDIDEIGLAVIASLISTKS